MKEKWWIGCSGFHYKHWKNIFYPKDLPQTKWFDFYIRHFNTLELNVTFYRFPRLSALENWYNISPDDFMFSIKMNKAITHYKQFNDTERMISDFYATAREGLKNKLGCVLFQMPPRTRYTPERLEKIIYSLNPSFENVLEFRHVSWWHHDVFSALTQNNVSFCGMSHPEFSEDMVANTETVYYRFHGIPELYKSPYTLLQLKKIANGIREAGVRSAYLYFNNDINGSALVNAAQMRDFCKSEG